MQMKYKLPLLLVLSLMWQALASADEWTNIATAVTVTEGRFCVGEAALDGTGTDIKCDDSTPYIDDDGNIGIGTASPTVLLDVSGTLKISDGGEACSGSTAGAVRYGGNGNIVEYCNSSAWVTLGPSGTEIPAFSVHRNGVNQSTSGDTAVDYTHKSFDTYDNFDLTTDRFTPTVPGYYLFIIQNYCDGGANYCQSSLTKNGSIYATSFSYGNGDEEIGQEIAIAYANGSSDYFDVIVRAGSSGTVLKGGSNVTYFAGNLLTASSAVGGGGGPIDLDELTDVNAGSPTEGQVLSWDDSSSEWVASDASAGVSALASLTDVSATDAATGSILRYDGTSWTAVADLMTAISTTTMVVNWPDAIMCGYGSGSQKWIMNHHQENGSGEHYYVYNFSSTAYWILFDSAGAYSNRSHTSGGQFDTSGTLDCDISIASYYAAGRAFNFLGNNGAQTSMTEIADVSASAPTEGQLLSYDASENEWVATDVISKTIIYNSIDDDPCVVTGGVHKLSFNPTTGRLRVCRP